MDTSLPIPEIPAKRHGHSRSSSVALSEASDRSRWSFTDSTHRSSSIIEVGEAFPLEIGHIGGGMQEITLDPWARENPRLFPSSLPQPLKEPALELREYDLSNSATPADTPMPTPVLNSSSQLTTPTLPPPSSQWHDESQFSSFGTPGPGASLESDSVGGATPYSTPQQQQPSKLHNMPASGATSQGVGHRHSLSDAYVSAKESMEDLNVAPPRRQRENSSAFEKKLNIRANTPSNRTKSGDHGNETSQSTTTSPLKPTLPTTTKTPTTRTTTTTTTNTTTTSNTSNTSNTNNTTSNTASNTTRTSSPPTTTSNAESYFSPPQGDTSEIRKSEMLRKLQQIINNDEESGDEDLSYMTAGGDTPGPRRPSGPRPLEASSNPSGVINSPYSINDLRINRGPAHLVSPQHAINPMVAKRASVQGLSPLQFAQTPSPGARPHSTLQPSVVKRESQSYILDFDHSPPSQFELPNAPLPPLGPTTPLSSSPRAVPLAAPLAPLVSPLGGGLSSADRRRLSAPDKVSTDEAKIPERRSSRKMRHHTVGPNVALNPDAPNNRGSSNYSSHPDANLDGIHSNGFHDGYIDAGYANETNYVNSSSFADSGYSNRSRDFGGPNDISSDPKAEDAAAFTADLPPPPSGTHLRSTSSPDHRRPLSYDENISLQQQYGRSASATNADSPQYRNSSYVPKTRSRRNFTKKSLEDMMQQNPTSYDIQDIGLPKPERVLLEKFIDSLSKLSIEVQMDEGKREEGRRRLNNALRALEGWF